MDASKIPLLNGLLAMADGRKGAITIVVVVFIFAGFFLGRITFDQLDGMLRWLIGVFVAGTAVEDAAKHLASRPKASGDVTTTVVTNPQPPSERPSPIVVS